MKSLARCLIAALWAGLPVPDAHGLDVAVSFSSEMEGVAPRRTGETEFTCSDTVYILIESPGLEPGVHDVELRWYDPTGERRELTKFPAHANPGEPIWAWLKLHAPAKSGLVRAVDPSHGMRDFIGRWKVKVLIDDRPAADAAFDMLC